MAFGSTNSCQVSNSNSATVAGSQIAGAAIAKVGAASPNADDFTTLNGAASVGCSTTDVTFSVFTSSGGVGGGAATDGGTYISTLTNQNLTLTTPIEAVFSTVRGNDTQNTGGNDSTNTWVGSNNGTTYNVDYEFVSTGGSVKYFSLDLLGAQVGTGGGTLTGTVSLCLGGTWSTGGTGGTCSGTAQTFNITTGTTAYDVALTNAAATIGVKTSFDLNNGGTGNAGVTFVTSLEEGFAESPEPGSFVLLGSALAGLGFMRLRRKKA